MIQTAKAIGINIRNFNTSSFNESEEAKDSISLQKYENATQVPARISASTLTKMTRSRYSVRTI